jgi:8-oxo-dGTP pyrophosphatase MutT (NUDIX family)
MSLTDIMRLPSTYTDRDVTYLPKPSTVDLVITNDTPPAGLTPTAFLLAFVPDGNCVFANNLRRGIEISGGHIDPGETPEQAAIRELEEETGYRVTKVYPVGVQRCISRGVPDEAYLKKYPYPTSFQQFFAGIVESVGERTAPEECGEPILRTPAEVAEATDFTWPSIKILHEAALRILHAEDLLDTQPEMSR